MSETFHEIVVKGPLKVIRGYIAGLLVGKGVGTEEVIFAEDRGVATEGVLGEMAEWMHLTENVSHLLVPDSLHADVSSGLEHAPKPLGLHITADKEVRSASFDFSYTAYNKRLADEFDRLFKSFADSVRLSDDYRPVEVVDPDAAGAEAYSPAHDFEAKAKGTATGDLESILELHGLCDEHSLMTVEKIRLHHAAD